MRVVLDLMLTVALAAGCTQFPAVDAAVSPAALAAPYPDLLPLDEVLAAAASTGTAEDAEAALAARVATLRAKAAALRSAGCATDADPAARCKVPE